MNRQIPVLLLLFTSLFSFALFADNVTLKIGDHPPELAFRNLNAPGETISWKDLNNQVVVIDFWATWCPPCREAIPHLNGLVKEFEGKPVTFISITYEPERMTKPFLEEHKLNTIVGIDNDFGMFKSYNAWGIPMVVIVNKNGRIASVIHPKYLTRDVIEDVLEGKIPQVKQHEGWPDPEGAENYFRSSIKSVPVQ